MGPRVTDHDVAIYGGYGVTCSCGELLLWPAHWWPDETTAKRLVARHENLDQAHPVNVAPHTLGAMRRWLSRHPWTYRLSDL